MITLEELGRTRTSSAGHLVDPGQQLVGRRVERLAAGNDVGAELGEEPLEALAGGDREGPRPPAVEPRPPLGDLLAHVGDVEVGDLAGPLEEGHRGLGLVGVDVDLERRLVADDEDRVAEALEAGQEVARGEAAAGDDEVGAVAVAAVLVVGPAERAAPRGGRPRARAAPSPRRPATTPARIRTRP